MPAVQTPSLASFMGDGAGAPPFALVVVPLPPGLFTVHAVTGVERMSAPYRFELEVTAPYRFGHDYERVMLGMRAVLVMHVGSVPRGIHGVVRSMRCEGLRAQGHRIQYRVELVPGFALLDHTRRSRVFQDLSVTEVIARVLSPHLPVRFGLSKELPKRAYLTQYEESDRAFVERLGAEAGLFYFFTQPAALLQKLMALGADALAELGPAGEVAGAALSLGEAQFDRETIVFGDDIAAYPPVEDGSLIGSLAAAADTVASAAGATKSVGTAGTGGVQTVASPTLHYTDLGGMTGERFDKVTRLEPAWRVATTHTEFRDFDPERPRFPVASTAPDATSLLMNLVNTGLNALVDPENAFATLYDSLTDDVRSALLAEQRFDYYDHHGHFLFPDWEGAKGEAARILKQRRRRAHTASGASSCSGLAPGHRFTLEDHPISGWNREYVVCAVRHRGAIGSERPLYDNTFTCVPASQPYPARRPKRRTVQALLTASVIGPPGEAIHVDRAGRIKVRFHWDREGAADGSSTCWIRTMQSWGGEGWGSQFIPRVGMEVVVGFDGGDPDKPIVLGSVHNGTHPMPFATPAHKTRSGIRTRTVGSDEGHNELSFEDRAGAEQIYLHAQKDLEEVVEGHHALHTRTEGIVVAGDRSDRVDQDHVLSVGGTRDETVEHDHRLYVHGDRRAHVRQRDALEVTGPAAHRYRSGVVTEVDGEFTTIVGRHDAPASYVLHVHGTATIGATQGIVFDCPGGVEFRCGTSAVRIGKERVELSGSAVALTGSGASLEASGDGLKLASDGVAQVLCKNALLKSQGASLGMGSDVQVDGGKIYLNSPDSADEPQIEPEPPTAFVLVDQDGHALAFERYVITLSDGTQRAGMLDRDGKLSLELRQSGSIAFPDLGPVR